MEDRARAPPHRLPASARSAARPSRQGLAELLLVTGFLALAAAGAAALFGDELRAALGRPPAAAPGQPGPAGPPR